MPLLRASTVAGVFLAMLLVGLIGIIAQIILSAFGVPFQAVAMTVCGTLTTIGSGGFFAIFRYVVEHPEARNEYAAGDDAYEDRYGYTP